MASTLRLDPRAVVRVRSRRRTLDGSPLELARRFKQQLDAGEFQTGLALARAHGLSPSTVSRLIAVLDMPAPLQKLVDAGMRLQTAARIHALNPAEFSRVIRGLNAGQSIRALLGESKPRVKRIPRRGTRKLREAFAARLVEARLRLGVTQMELGALLGVAQNTVGSWEVANALPEIETLVRIADQLDVSLDWLLGRSKQSGSPARDTSLRRAR